MEQQTPANDAPRSVEWTAHRADEALKGWSDEDIDWLCKLQPAVVIPIAKRYGRTTMDIVIRLGVIGHAIELMNQSQPPAKIRNAIVVLAIHMNFLAKHALKGLGVDEAIMRSCQEDLDRLAALQDDGTGGKKSAGGIILAS